MRRSRPDDNDGRTGAEAGQRVLRAHAAARCSRGVAMHGARRSTRGLRRWDEVGTDSGEVMDGRPSAA